MPTSSNHTIVAHASCRVDLAGSTLDLWPLYLFHPGAVTVNFAVNILTRCQITPNADSGIHFKSIDTGREDYFRDFEEFCRARKIQHHLAAHLVRFFFPLGTPQDCGFTLETNSESPAGAGISGSSALMVATVAALARYTGRKLSREQVREIAQNVEAQLIRVPTGCQDYYPALYGGVSAIRLDVDGIHRQAIAVAPENIESRFVLVYTGAPRQSGINNWEVFKAHINGDQRVFRNFKQIGEIARAMHAALEAGDWKQVPKLLGEEWKLRRTNAPGITTPLMDKLISAAKRKGALAAKVCGAGGGGCFVLFVSEGSHDAVAEAIRQHGGRVLPFRVNPDGVTVVGRNRRPAREGNPLR
ncbi:MAG TPA: GHMP kinase [Verrucomicrobiae bacterium]|nr:GHMP kinase [Verrucomicrobiae bacterium]